MCQGVVKALHITPVDTPYRLMGESRPFRRGAIMIRLYLPFFLALFFLVVPKESVGQNGELADLNSVRIVVEKLESKERKLGPW